MITKILRVFAAYNFEFSKYSNILGIQITASFKQIRSESINQQVAANQIKSQYLTHPLERERKQSSNALKITDQSEGRSSTAVITTGDFLVGWRERGRKSNRENHQRHCGRRSWPQTHGHSVYFVSLRRFEIQGIVSKAAKLRYY